MPVTSFPQERLWFLEQLQPESAVYNWPVALRLTGALDVPALRRALDAVVARHESLRTRFALSEGEVHQAIDPPGPVSFTEVALEGGAAGLEDRMRAEALRPFDLAAGPLLRAVLYRLDAATHALLLTVHHITYDGWSDEILWRELDTLYTAFARGEMASLPPLSLQYADYATAQRRRLDGEALERRRDYWVKRLAGAPAALELPADHARPAVQSFRSGHHDFAVPAPLLAGLRALARRCGATLFMVLMAAFQTLLSRWSGQEDVVVGLPIAGRPRGTEGLIGFFVNTLALRTDLSGEPSFQAVVGQVRDALLAAYDHQDVPFEKVVEALQPTRDLSRPPLFQVLMNHLAFGRTRRLGEVRVEPIRLSLGVAPFDLALRWEESAERLGGTFDYAKDLFEAETIERMAGHLLVLLEAAAAAPETAITRLPLLGAAERQALLTTWNDTAAPVPEATIHRLVAAQAARSPAAVAAVCADQRLTYGALEARANRLAQHLRGLGVGPEVPVAIALERSLDLLVGILGILKAGGAYVPLDPAYPAERLAFILADTAAPVLLTQERLLAQLPPCRGHVLCLDRDWPLIEQSPAEAPESGVAPASLAYVIYTSGSTGKPKGVALTHGNAVAFLAWATAFFSRRELGAVLASTSVCFDLSVFEMFAPLSVGGSVVIVPNILALPALAYPVTLVNTVPSAMKQLLETTALPPSIVTVNLAGEPFAKELVSAVFRNPGVERLLNLYGPTEDTTYSTVAVFGPQTVRSSLIGRPLANKRLYVLDRHQEPVPVGVAGELYLAGAGLARGYLNRPALTAERFVDSPFSPGDRLYRTGDLGRRLADGSIDFLGRLDHQVKIRGFRIEPGEIEAVLREHAAVREAVVLAREDSPGDKRLVAYIVPAGDAPEAAELRALLKAKLPAFMVPAAFVILDALPLTANGKLDRKALPPPERDAADGAAYVAPQSPLEEIIAAIAADILQRDRLGIHDNFFDLGGHSLLAMRLIARLKDALLSDLPLRTLFEAPTVAQLAHAIGALPVRTGDTRRASSGDHGETAMAALLERLSPGARRLIDQRRETIGSNGPGQPAAESGQDYVVLRRSPGPSRLAICFLPAITGIGGHYLALAQRLALPGDCLTCRLLGTSPEELPLTRLEDIAAYCRAQLVIPAHYDAYLLIGWSFGGLLAYELARQLGAEHLPASGLILIDAYLPTARTWAGKNGAAAEDMNDAAVLRRLLQQELGGAEIEAAQFEAILRTYRANLAALRAYRPEGYDGALAEIRAEASAALLDDPLSPLAPVPARLRRTTLMAGDHYSIMASDRLAELASSIREALRP